MWQIGKAPANGKRPVSRLQPEAGSEKRNILEKEKDGVRRKKVSICLSGGRSYFMAYFHYFYHLLFF